MDHRLALLLQTYSGLKLNSEDLISLMAAPDPFSPEIAEALVSPPAREFIRANPGWSALSARLLADCRERGIRWSYWGQPDYPPGWRVLSESPVLFSYMGQPVWMSRPLLAVVGSRTPLTDTCLWLQRELAPFLRATGAGVVSGGARGVDQWAHRLALASRTPTVCVFPSGLLRPYPPGRADLWEAILLQDGCLLSTFAPDSQMRKQNFATRNRWIAGLADALFVAEANRRSGSFLSARMAIEEGREIATLPVSVNANQGLGNLELIKQAGAQLICDRSDLRAFFERVRGRHSGPGATERVQREEEKDQIHQPQSERGVEPS